MLAIGSSRLRHASVLVLITFLTIAIPFNGISAPRQNSGGFGGGGFSNTTKQQQVAPRALQPRPFFPNNNSSLPSQQKFVKPNNLTALGPAFRGGTTFSGAPIVKGPNGISYAVPQKGVLPSRTILFSSTSPRTIKISNDIKESISRKARNISGGKSTSSEIQKEIAVRGTRFHIRVYYIEGMQRERIVHGQLENQCRDCRVLRQLMLVDSNGKVVRTADGKGRRLDHIVVDKNGEIIKVVETTSSNANKTGQISREIIIKRMGGHYVKDPQSGSVMNLADSPSFIARVNIEANEVNYERI